MKKVDKKYMVGGIVLLLISLVIGRLIIQNANNNERVVTLITKSKEGYEWSNLIQGAQAAANEFGVDISVLAPDYEKDINSQVSLIESAIENRSYAIILAPIKGEKIKRSGEKIVHQGINFINIMAEEHWEESVTYVGTDNYNLGHEIGEEIIEIARKSKKDKFKVGIISNLDQESQYTLRIKGINDAINQQSNISLVSKYFSTDNEVYAEIVTKQMLDKYNDIDLIVGLNGPITQGIVNALSKQKVSKTKVIGIDLVAQLRKEVFNPNLESVYIQNFFAIGYQSVENALSKNSAQKNNHVIETIHVKEGNFNRENIYKIIYPFD